MIIIRSSQKWSGKWCMDKFMLPLRQIRVYYFFRAVYHSKNHVISHPIIAAILDVILKFYNAEKTTTTTCQSNSPNTMAVENYQKIIINCS